MYSNEDYSLADSILAAQKRDEEREKEKERVRKKREDKDKEMFGNLDGL